MSLLCVGTISRRGKMYTVGFYGCVFAHGYFCAACALSLRETAGNHTPRGTTSSGKAETLIGYFEQSYSKLFESFTALTTSGTQLDCFALLLTEELPRLTSEMDSMVIRLATRFSRTTLSTLSDLARHHVLGR
jgi:hypothetical protein